MRDDDYGAVESQVALLLRLSDRSRRWAPHRRTGELDRSAHLVLGVLTEGGARSVNSIAEALRLDPSTVTRQVLAMEQSGLVDRGTDPRDRRVTLVTPTDDGRAALDRTRQIRSSLYREVLGDWAPEDRDRLTQLLTRLNTDLDAWEQRHSEN